MNIGCKKAVVVKAAAFFVWPFMCFENSTVQNQILLYNYYNVIICLIHSDIYKGKYI